MKIKLLLLLLVFSNSFFAQTIKKKYVWPKIITSSSSLPDGFYCFKNSIEFDNIKQEVVKSKQDSLIINIGVKSVIIKSVNKKFIESFEYLAKRNQKGVVYQSYSGYDKNGDLVKRYKEGFNSNPLLEEISYQYDSNGILQEKEIMSSKFYLSELNNNFYKKAMKRKPYQVLNKNYTLKYDSLNRTKRIKISEKENEITKKFKYNLDTTTVVSSDLKGKFLERVDEFFRNDTIKEIHSFSIRENVESVSKTSYVDELFFNTNNKLLKKISLNRSKYNDPYSKEFVFKSRRTSFYNYHNDVLHEKKEMVSINSKTNCSCKVKYSYNTYGLIDKIENEVTIPNSEKKFTATTTFEYEFHKN